MTESTLLNYTTADFSTKADMEIRIYRWQEIESNMKAEQAVKVFANRGIVLVDDVTPRT